MEFPNDKTPGETMTTQTVQNKKYPTCARAQRLHDVMLVSSFGVWAAVLGLSPVFAFRLLMGS
jgi:hypothetical protein